MWEGDVEDACLVYEGILEETRTPCRREIPTDFIRIPFPGCWDLTTEVGVRQRNAHVPELFRCLEITSRQLARQRATLQRAIAVAGGGTRGVSAFG